MPSVVTDPPPSQYHMGGIYIIYFWTLTLTNQIWTRVSVPTIYIRVLLMAIMVNEVFITSFL